MFDYLQKTSTNYPLFPKVTDLDIHFHKDWPCLSLQSLSMFIDISQIVQIKLHTYYFDEYKQNALIDIGIFLEQAHILSSLIIRGSYKLCRIIENVYSIIPCPLKHLQIPIIIWIKYK
jgi:hypothetical protein